MRPHQNHPGPDRCAGAEKQERPVPRPGPSAWQAGRPHLSPWMHGHTAHTERPLPGKHPVGKPGRESSENPWPVPLSPVGFLHQRHPGGMRAARMNTAGLPDSFHGSEPEAPDTHPKYEPFAPGRLPAREGLAPSTDPLWNGIFEWLRGGNARRPCEEWPWKLPAR